MNYAIVGANPVTGEFPPVVEQHFDDKINDAIKLDLPGGVQASGLRRSALTFANAGAQQWETGLDEAHQRIPARFPVSTKRWRLRIGNSRPDGALQPGAININGIWIGKAARNGGNQPTGAFAATPIKALSGFSTPVNGSDYVSPWVDAADLQFEANQDMLVSMGWTKQNVQLFNGGGRMYFSTGTGRSADASAIAPTTTDATFTAFHVSVEYEFDGLQRIGVAIGDSLTEGTFTSPIPWGGHGMNSDVWHQVASLRSGIPIAMIGDHGSTSSQWATAIDSYLRRMVDGGWNVDFAIIQLGVNDAESGVNVSGYQTRITNIIDAIRARGVRDIYLNTLAPRGYASSDNKESLRLTYNQWIRRRPANVRGVFDVENALADATARNNLRADYAYGDLVHWTPEGHLRASSVISF